MVEIIRGDRADKNHYVNFEEGGYPRVSTGAAIYVGSLPPYENYKRGHGQI